MNLTKAVSLMIGDADVPVVSDYRLGLIIHQLYRTKRYKDSHLTRLEKVSATRTEFLREISKLLDAGILQKHPNFRGNIFTVLGRKTDDVSEVVCAVDPFCYVSHLSAMSHHGLTNRLPAKLFISSPAPARWSVEARNQMLKDLGDDLASYLQNEMPRLSRPKITRVDRMEVHRFSSIHWGAFRNVGGKALRVSTIGRTFLDMLRSPILCGGIDHVIEVWADSAQPYLKAIINEFELHGGPIDKVRAGYILEERMKVRNDVVDSWTQFASRGGSRKLDPSAEYVPDWSEKWCLSLNT